MLNKVLLIGNVGKDPEVRTFEGGSKLASFTLATSETFKNKQGEKQTNTEWHNIKIFGKLAEIVEKYVKKGQSLYLEGSVKYRTYEKDGQKKYFTEINCFTMQMLAKKESNTQSAPEQPIAEPIDDDLPF